MPRLDLKAIATLEELDGTSPGMTLLEEVVSTYLETSPALVETLKNAASSGELRAMIAAAHSLKSSSALVGAIEFSEACEQIEKVQSIDSMTRELVARTASEFEFVKGALKEILRERAPSPGKP